MASYVEIVKRLDERSPGICHDPHACSDPRCRTLVKAMLEQCQGSPGWTLMFALDAIAQNNTLEELIAAWPGNALLAALDAVSDYRVCSEDYLPALDVHKALSDLLEVDDGSWPPPVETYLSQ